MTFDVSVLFRIAAIGIAIALLNQILTKAGREEQAMMTTLAGVIIVLAIVIRMISVCPDSVKEFAYHPFNSCRGDNRPGNSYKDDKRIL